MGTVRYTTIQGEVIAEKRAGVRRSYVPDPLGSTVVLLDNTQAQTDTFSYWPYGEVKARTGTTTTPFQFVGTLGYYRDSSGRDYVRARHLRKDLSRWQTEDPIGVNGSLNLYNYASAQPATLRDPSGLTPAIILVGCGIACGCVAGMVAECIADASRFPPNEWGDAFLRCMKDTYDGLPPWGQVLVGLCYGGCIACVIAAIRELPKPKPKPRPPQRGLGCGPVDDVECAAYCVLEHGCVGGKCYSKLGEFPSCTCITPCSGNPKPKYPDICFQ